MQIIIHFIFIHWNRTTSTI